MHGRSPAQMKRDRGLDDLLEIEQVAQIDFYSFTWKYKCSVLPWPHPAYIRDHLIMPLLFINSELQRQMKILKFELTAKDREIEAYRNKGQRILKGLATATFSASEWTEKQLASQECMVRGVLTFARVHANCVCSPSLRPRIRRKRCRASAKRYRSRTIT